MADDSSRNLLNEDSNHNNEHINLLRRLRELLAKLDFEEKTLEEEFASQLAAQEALRELNAALEKKVLERTRELQAANITLKAEIGDRLAAEEELRIANAALETRVLERTDELQAINTALQGEIGTRQTAQDALIKSRDELIVSQGQLKHYSAELTETNRELKSFSNIVAHDFRAPMVNLAGFSKELSDSLIELTQIIRDEPSHFQENVQSRLSLLLEKDVPESLKYIQSSVNRLSRMVDALLKLARLGRRDMIYNKVDMNELVRNILQSFSHQIGKKIIQVKVGTLPQTETDHLAMEQIMSNLLDNAIKYLEPNRPGKIGISCADAEEGSLFSVQDNGRGIAPQDREKIFEIFGRTGKQDLPGDGMGLACVRTLIRQLGGKIWCESRLGVGTTIKFILPQRPNL
ncbi:MAG: HAMP domain-containing sensor histidine kinase [Negativicutes bacterium]|nr:HAMP domain-containing sensor histidine kinase [Negativicutes bacterium]